MAPTKPTRTSTAQTTERTSTRCSTRIFFTLASRSGTTRIVYDLSRRPPQEMRYTACRGRCPLNHPEPPALPVRGGNPSSGGSSATWARDRALASLRPLSELRDVRQLVYSGWRVGGGLTRSTVRGCTDSRRATCAQGRL